jgi:DNA-directed RNA polymerase specialized sigma24 family protein
VGSQELFDRYLAARAPGDDPDGTLNTLLTDCAQPILNRVVRSRLGSLYTQADAAELSSEAMLELLARLRALREEGAAAANLPFHALAAGVAANTVHRFFARRFPERNRLRKRLRYVIETDGFFRLWAGTDGAAICGLARARGDEPLADAAGIQRCLDRLRQRPLAVHPLPHLVLEILRTLASPIDLTRLTTLVADRVGIKEPTWISAPSGGEEEVAGAPADPAPSAEKRLEVRQRLERLWTEVLLLSARHRSALLLSSRVPSGAALWLMVDLGVASFREVAGALEMCPEELAELWNRLPLEDREIAARLGLDRQQVINLRSTARERLVRRENAGASGSGPITKGNR